MKPKNLDIEKIARAVEADADMTLDDLRESLGEMKAYMAGKPVSVNTEQGRRIKGVRLFCPSLNVRVTLKAVEG